MKIIASIRHQFHAATRFVLLGIAYRIIRMFAHVKEEIEIHGRPPSLVSESSQIFLQYIKPLLDQVNELCRTHSIPVIVLIDIDNDHMYTMQVTENMGRPLPDPLMATAIIIHAAQQGVKLAITRVDQMPQYFDPFDETKKNDEQKPN